MYISRLSVHNYRNFEAFSIRFRDGINLLTGSDDSGKTNLLSALEFVLSPVSGKRLRTADICSTIPLQTLKQHSPCISIVLYFSQSDHEDAAGDELVTVSDWLVRLEEPYQARLQYEFFLPETEEGRYQQRIMAASDTEEARRMIEEHFIRLYIGRTWVGNPENQIALDSEKLTKFNFQYRKEQSYTLAKWDYTERLLDQMQKDADSGYMGSNAKVFSVFALEAAKVRMDPDILLRFIQFLRDRVQAGKIKQLFITSYAAELFLAMEPDEIVPIQNPEGCESL